MKNDAEFYAKRAFDNLNHGNFNLMVKEILNVLQILVTFLILKE